MLEGECQSWTAHFQLDPVARAPVHEDFHQSRPRCEVGRQWFTHKVLTDPQDFPELTSFGAGYSGLPPSNLEAGRGVGCKVKSSHTPLRQSEVGTEGRGPQGLGFTPSSFVPPPHACSAHLSRPVILAHCGLGRALPEVGLAGVLRETHQAVPEVALPAHAAVLVWSQVVAAGVRAAG